MCHTFPPKNNKRKQLFCFGGFFVEGKCSYLQIVCLILWNYLKFSFSMVGLWLRGIERESNFHICYNVFWKTEEKLAKTWANLSHASGKVWVGGTEREMCGGREEERMEKVWHIEEKLFPAILYELLCWYPQCNYIIIFLNNTSTPLCWYNEFMGEKLCTHVLSLSITGTPALLSFWQQNDPSGEEQMRAAWIWMRSFWNRRHICYNCQTGVISCRFMNQSHRMTQRSVSQTRNYVTQVSGQIKINQSTTQ